MRNFFKSKQQKAVDTFALHMTEKLATYETARHHVGKALVILQRQKSMETAYALSGVYFDLHEKCEDLSAKLRKIKDNE